MERGEISKGEKDQLDIENRAKEYTLGHQLLDMVKQLPNPEKEIANRIEAEIQVVIHSYLEEFGDETMPVHLDEATIEAFGYTLDEFPMTDAIQAEIDKLKEKYGERLV